MLGRPHKREQLAPVYQEMGVVVRVADILTILGPLLVTTLVCLYTGVLVTGVGVALDRSCFVSFGLWETKFRQQCMYNHCQTRHAANCFMMD